LHQAWLKSRIALAEKLHANGKQFRENSLMRCVIICLTLLLVDAALRGEDEKVDLDQVPKPVLQAVKARFKDARVTGVSKEKEDGKVVYEVTIKDRDRNIDVTVTPEGEIVLIEKEIAPGDLPKAVARTLEEKYPKATYKIVEEVIKVQKKVEKLAYYEVLLVTAEKKKLEVQVSAEGKVIKEEKKGEKDD
jgi:uncharacterized membrane protein YkoI